MFKVPQPPQLTDECMNTCVVVFFYNFIINCKYMISLCYKTVPLFVWNQFIPLFVRNQFYIPCNFYTDSNPVFDICKYLYHVYFVCNEYSLYRPV